ncbi:MAG: ribbon-helix-helix domain-containing protein [Candidatus Fermentithermobacillus carboniphilus]|uniref:Ribbon-helix-helix domain-containing protein n=1 Tax=Candidatus Fermentithermobacillus carboniphilus TaxID=3085328 RepID=A0AAT9LEB4_9FIRM|nr:MAG: ribbon-helix-helix domain-containing protein [Candidatus Fermentithermobacillus carboniphilus]
MVRTQVQLTEEQFEALKAMSAASGVSLAEIVRRAVDRMISEYRGSERDDCISRAIAVAGKFRSGLGDLSVEHDKYFVEAMGG